VALARISVISFWGYLADRCGPNRAWKSCGPDRPSRARRLLLTRPVSLGGPTKTNMNKKSERKPTIDEVFAALDADRIPDDLFRARSARMLQARLDESGRITLLKVVREHSSAAELFPGSTHSSACEICVNTVLKR